VILAVATVATAIVSEILVHTLEGFADAAGLSQFFVSAVIVALVGNAAEHGGAVVVARRGKIRLASEIAVSSAAQVALLVAPLAALLSFAIRPPLPLAFRPVELATMAGAAVIVGVVIRDERGTRREGLVLVAAYAACVLAYYLSGNR
jgi:Ca2+:H+ antiporter